MKKSNNQSGSAHIFVIVALVIAVLGLLGFVLWQNFIQKDSVTTTEDTPISTVKTAETPAATVPESTDTTLTLGTYGVAVPYDSATDTYTLTDATTGSFAGGFIIHSKKVTEACGDSVNVGAIKRFNKGDSLPTPSNHVTIGDYDYVLGVGGYGDCGTGAEFDVLNTASTAFADAFDNLKVTE